MKGERKMSGDIKRSLTEIIPKLDESLSNGLVIENGILKDIADQDAYIAYTGQKDSGSGSPYFPPVVYIPPEVIEFDEDFNYFNCPGAYVETFVITTNMKMITDVFFMRGFENFYIVDADTKEVVFYSDKFLVPEGSYDFVSFIDEFAWFLDDYANDPLEAIKDSEFGIYLK